MPENTKWVTHFEKGAYDLAILNIDQQCSNPQLNKANLTRQMKRAIKDIEPEVPIVFINHGTPVYPELYNDASKKTNYLSKTLIKEILNIVGDDYMVVNSRQAASDWGRGYPIIHGMDIEEWPASDEKESRVATFISQAGIGDRYYNRSFLASVIEELKAKHGITLQWVNTPNCFNSKNINDYKYFLSKTLVYFNPTFGSPMPRSRTEAMLAGCCVVTTPTHDADTFIQDGYNGFLVPHDNVGYAVEIIAKLLKDYDIAKETGKRGRETAIQLFNRERYKNDWLKFLKEEVKIEI